MDAILSKSDFSSRGGERNLECVMRNSELAQALGEPGTSVPGRGVADV